MVESRQILFPDDHLWKTHLQRSLPLANALAEYQLMMDHQLVRLAVRVGRTSCG